ncbi:hypothetical protein PSP6_420046 [Paraburkholderia tropica]|nr:hypothetical protein PSP6_420046 [Paraburkholderia tropica]
MLFYWQAGVVRDDLPACNYSLAAAGALSAAEAAPFFAFFFFGFFTCFSVGAEYDDTALDSCGAAGWANDGCASAATPKAVNINTSFFIRFSERRFF